MPSFSDLQKFANKNRKLVPKHPNPTTITSTTTATATTTTTASATTTATATATATTTVHPTPVESATATVNEDNDWDTVYMTPFQFYTQYFTKVSNEAPPALTLGDNEFTNPFPNISYPPTRYDPLQIYEATCYYYLPSNLPVQYDQSTELWMMTPEADSTCRANKQKYTTGMNNLDIFPSYFQSRPDASSSVLFAYCSDLSSNYIDCNDNENLYYFGIKKGSQPIPKEDVQQEVVEIVEVQQEEVEIVEVQQEEVEIVEVQQEEVENEVPQSHTAEDPDPVFKLAQVLIDTLQEFIDEQRQPET